MHQRSDYDFDVISGPAPRLPAAPAAPRPGAAPAPRPAAPAGRPSAPPTGHRPEGATKGGEAA